MQSDAALAPVLEVHGLTTQIRTRKGLVHAVDGVSFQIEEGETLGLVGESGCGKTMAAMSIMKLLPNGGHIAAGRVMLLGRDLVPLTEPQMCAIRGNEIGVIFQDPMTSLNPTMTIGRQIAEPLRVHRHLTSKQAVARVVEVLGEVGIPRPNERLGAYPHQLSGGLRQRAMIAMALACEPKLLIADEPTTALDVTIQAQILSLLDSLRRKFKMAILMITHDLGVIAGRADRVCIMYAGKVVERSRTDQLFASPHHPYTQALLASIPRPDQNKSETLVGIPGLPPDLTHPPIGCHFHPRCRYATADCMRLEPLLEGPTVEHVYACFHPVGEGVTPSQPVKAKGVETR